MAIKPTEPDPFIKEVDEALRQEQLSNFFARYGWWIIAGIVLLLAAVGGTLWWKDRQRTQAGEQGEALLQAIQHLERGEAGQATPLLAELETSRIKGYRAAALFTRAGIETEAGNLDAAIATLRTIAEDQSLGEPYRQAALVRQTTLEFDRIQPQVVIQRLGNLARPGQAWFGTAGELVGIAHVRMNRPDLAGPLFAQIGRDETVPASIRTRAIQMAGALGVNAMPDTGAGAAPRPVQNPAEAGPAREKAE